MIGFCLAIPGLKPGGATYLHSHMLGVLPEYRNARRRPPAEAARSAKTRWRAASTSSSGPSIRSSSRTPTSTSSGWARSCGATCSTSTAPPPATCTADCRPTAASPSGGSTRDRVQAILDRRAVSRAGDRGAHRRARRHRRASATTIRSAPARSSRPSASSFSKLLRTRARRHRLRAHRRRPAPTCWGHGIPNEDSTASCCDRSACRWCISSRPASAAPTERDIILVEVGRRRRLRLGRSHRRRESLLQRRVDRLAPGSSCATTSRPRVLGTGPRSPPPTSRRSPPHIRGHHMARGGLEAAVWDLEARLDGRAAVASRSAAARAARSPAASPSAFRTRSRSCSKRSRREARRRLSAHQDEDQARLGRRRRPPRCASEFPAIKLMADANSAYTLADTEHLKQLDEFYLMMIEQPLAHDDIIDHAALQAQLADADLPRRVHPHRAPRRAGDPAARLRHHQHQARTRRRLRRGEDAFTTSRRRAGIPGVVRRHARSRHRPRAQHRALHAAQLRPARRRLGQQALLEARHHRPAGRSHAARHDRSPRRARLRLRARPRTSCEQITVREETIG